MKKMIRSPLFVPIVSAPILFGIAALLLSLGNYDGAWFYVLYFLLHGLSAALFFLALNRAFRALPRRGVLRGLLFAIPILVSLSVYHAVIAFFDAYVVQFEDAPAALFYALLSFLTDSLFSEWLLLGVTYAACYLFFLRKSPTPLHKRAAELLAALLYFAFQAVGRITEFLSFRSARFGVVDEKTTLSFLLFLGSDLLLAAVGYLVLALSARADHKEDLK